MKIHRKHFLAAVAAASLLALGAGPAFAQKVLKYTHYQPAGNDQPKHAAALAFKDHVEKATNGSLKVELYPAGQLGPAQQVMEGLRLGTVELAVVHDGGIPGVYKTFNIFGLPFLFNDHAHAYAVLDGKFGQELAEDMRKRTGIRLMAYADNGIRHFTNSKRAIKTPEDMKGLKIRVQPSPVFVKLVESLGASPTAIDWANCPPRSRRARPTARKTASPTSWPPACSSTRNTSRWTATSTACTPTWSASVSSTA